MTVNAQDILGKPVKARKETLVLENRVTFGSTGAIASQDTDDPAFSLGTLTTGVGALTFPACRKASIRVEIKSAAATVTECILTAKAATSGTATLRFSKAGTAANPASGDIATITVTCQTGA